MRAPLALLVLLPFASPAQGPLVISKEVRVALRVPIALAEQLDPKRGLLSPVGYRVLATDSGVVVNGTAQWLGKGLPVAQTMRVAEVKLEKKTAEIRVKLDRPKGSDLHVWMPAADTAALFPALFAVAADSARVAAAGRDAARTTMFSGPAGALGEKGQRHILDLIDSIGRDQRIAVKAFQGKPYIVVLAAPTSYTYNTNQTSEAERYTGSINDAALPVIRALGAADSAMTDAYGFAVAVIVKSRPMGERSSWFSSTDHEELVIYVPASIAAQFARAEITSQDVVDKSAVMVKGNRIKVDLTR